MLQENLSDLDIVKRNNALKIRHLIGQGKINPQSKNAKGQDLLLQSLLKDIESLKIHAILSSAKRAGKMPDIKRALQVLEQECIGKFSVCYYNLSKPMIDADKKELVLQLLAGVSESERKKFVALSQFLMRAIVRKDVSPAPVHINRSPKTPKTNVGYNHSLDGGWALA